MSVKTVEPIRCDRCKRTDRGPFAKLSVPGTTADADTILCKGCCDELGIPVEHRGFDAKVSPETFEEKRHRMRQRIEDGGGLALEAHDEIVAELLDLLEEGRVLAGYAVDVPHREEEWKVWDAEVAEVLKREPL